MAVDPRRLDTGAAQKAGGTLKPDPGQLSEFGSAASAPIRDAVPALGSRQQAARTWQKMADGDVSVDVSLRAGKTPVQGAEFFLTPFNAEPDNLVIRDFVDFNIFHGTTAPFLHIVTDLLTAYEQGWAVMEKVFELREWVPDKKMANRGKYVMLRKLAPRPATTISKVTYDANGGPQSVTQQVIDPNSGQSKDTDIPIEKLMILTLNKRGGDVTGRSMLRPAYKHWFYKENLYKIDAIQKERHAIGIPDVELMPGFTADDKAAAEELAANLRTNERAYVVRPPGLVVSFIRLEGQLVDVMASAEHHDGMIMKNLLVQFLNMGLERSGGGRATASSQTDIFIKAMRYIAGLICELFNLYLIPQLVAYNFDTDKFPKMEARGIGETRDLQQFAAGLANLAANNLITLDTPTENWVRKQFDMPAKEGEWTPSAGATSPLGAKPKPVAPAPQDPQAPVPNGGGNGNQKGAIKDQIRTGNVRPSGDPASQG